MSEPSGKKRKIDDKSNVSRGPTITDSRFANIQSDPRYRLPGKKQRVKVDKRFARALRDEDFSRRSRVDRYGRPLETDSERKRLKRKYEFEDDEFASDKSESGTEEVDDDDEVQKELERVEKVYDPLREGKDIDTSSDETSSDEDLDDLEEDEEESAQAQSREIPSGEVTTRIAVVNLDWDNIRAEDLMAVFNSFLPATGRLLRVSIYPSEFGQERMQKEELEGPPTEVFAKSSLGTRLGGSESESEDDEDDEQIKASLLKTDDGSEFDSTALRQYQLDRLRYFYAVLEFSSTNAAKAIYDAVDGTEYLSTANLFDLRFVPEDTDFTSDTPRESCGSLPQGYRPNEFVTDALQHSKVKLTWDADDKSRKEASARAFRGGRKDIEEDDLKAYLGTDSSDGEAESEVEADTGVEASQSEVSKKEVERQKMRALLGLGPVAEKKSKKSGDAPIGGVQITFSAGLSSSRNDETKNRSVFENSPEPDETTVEKYVRKERERKQKRKDKMKQGQNEDAEEDIVEIKPSEKAEVVVQSTVNTTADDGEDLGFDDPFFAAPSAPETKASSSKIRKEDRLRKKQEREAEEAADRKQRAELELLMSGDVADGESTTKQSSVRHFDMKEIEKAEKKARKLDKKRKDNKSHKEAAKGNVENVVDPFEMNTTDPRFARLFENHEYAIDPTNPRFKGTKGMNALLDKARTRKTERVDDGNKLGSTKSTASSRQKATGKAQPVQEAAIDTVKSLADKIKNKNKGQR